MTDKPVKPGVRKCPVCEGTGFLNTRTPPEFINEMKKLREQGLSLRQIGKYMGIAGNTVLYHLRKWQLCDLTNPREKGEGE